MLIKLTKIVVIGLFTAALTSCAARGPIGQASDIKVTDLTALPPPALPPYKIGEQEEVDIRVLGSDLLTGKYLTDEQGLLVLPLVGEIHANGLTANELARVIEGRLRGNLMIDPSVVVRPTQVAPPTISIGGDVNKPGTFAAATSPTLLRAVNNAGGLTQYANSKEVLVMRTAQGQHFIGVFNIAAIERGNYPDPAIFPGDIVAVGDSPARRRLDRILQIFPAITSAIILFDRVQNSGN